MTMKAFVTEGTVELIPCETCRQLVPATYSLGPVEHEGLIVEDVMRAVCNQCGDIIATTPQSAHRFRERIAEIQKGLEELRTTKSPLSKKLRPFSLAGGPLRARIATTLLVILVTSRQPENGYNPRLYWILGLSEEPRFSQDSNDLIHICHSQSPNSKG
jgi:hypothetical protein